MKKYLLLSFFLGVALFGNATEVIEHSSTDTLFVSDKSVNRILMTESCVVVIGDNVIFEGYNDWRFGFNKEKGNFKVVADSITLFASKSFYAIQNNPTITFELNYLSSPIILDGTSSTLNVKFEKGVISIDEIQCDSLIIGNNTSLRCKSFTTNKILDINENEVYEVILPHNSSQSFTLQKDEGAGYVDYIDYSFNHFHVDGSGNTDSYYYIYLPNGNYSVTTGTEDYTFAVDGNAVNLAIKPTIEGDGLVDLSGGVFSFTENGYQVGYQSYTYDGSNGYTFTGTTSNSFVIPDSLSVDAITLSGVSLSSFTIQKTGDFEIILDGYSSLEGKIAYTGDGALTISGTASDNSDTLALITRYGHITGNKVIVKSGTVISRYEICNNDAICYFTGSYIASGILFVEGGVVSCYYLGDSTVINGGVFEKYNDMATCDTYVSAGAIGTITFNGGMSYIELWNAENPGLDENVKINGGSVHITNPCTSSHGNFDQVYSFAADGSPTRSDDSIRLYQCVFKLPVSIGTAVDSIKVDDVLYPSNAVYTDTAYSVYLWIPETAEDVATTNTSIFVDGTEFKFGGYIDAQFQYDAYESAANPGRGNKQEIIPLLCNTSENGSYVLSGDYMTEYNNAWYACSRTDISITTTPDTDYELDSIVINDEELSDTVFTVVRPDQDYTSMDISVVFKAIETTAINTTTQSNVIVYGTQNAINITGAENATVQVINLSGVKVYEAQNVSADCISVKSGLYIVVVDNAIYKVVVE